MHVISRRALVEFWEKYPDCKHALARWYVIVDKSDFATLSELRCAFPSADLVDRWVVFNIGGNKSHLIAAIHFNRNRLYVRHVLTHQEYDKGNWKKP